MKNLTVLEEQVIRYVANTLSGNFGEGYSDIDHAEVARECGLDINTVKGVVGSLVKKKIVYVFDWHKTERDGGGSTIHIEGQAETTFEDYVKAINKASELNINQIK